jgi:hypothetical protein
MQHPSPHIEFAPPPLPQISGEAPKTSSAGKVLAITSVLTFGLGILPLLLFVVMALEGNNILALLVMGVIGFCLHLLALIAGIVGGRHGLQGSGHPGCRWQRGHLAHQHFELSLCDYVLKSHLLVDVPEVRRQLDRIRVGDGVRLDGALIYLAHPRNRADPFHSSLIGSFCYIIL